MAKGAKIKKGKQNAYKKWGYLFLIPFIVTYVVFQLTPLVFTVYNSFFENYRIGLKQVGPTFIGFDNYVTILKNPDLWMYAKNTMIMWLIGFVPQIIVSLLLGAWFSDKRLRLRFSRFFKTVIYLPNIIMASAFAMLFYTLFSVNGPVNDIIVSIGTFLNNTLGPVLDVTIRQIFTDFKFISEPIAFFDSVWGVRGLVAFMNFLMWFGNTTILLMAGMMSIDNSLYEAAEVDGATSGQVFRMITLPLLKPILLYVVITSLIGGVQMFDVPQILTNGEGNPMRQSMTLIMYLNTHLYSKNYGMAGALSVLLFIATAILSFIIFKVSGNSERVKVKGKGKR